MNLGSRRVLAGLLVLALLLAGLPAALNRSTAARAARAAPVPVTSHPRIWITTEDLPRLRGWATESNPIWQDGLMPLAEQLQADVASGSVPGDDDGSQYWQRYPTESYAEFFAFLSLVHPDEETRQTYAQQSRDLLMVAIDEAAKGVAEDQPFRDDTFVAPHSDRARWWGEGWALTVDWIYPTLTAEDKATIRGVFLRWAEEIVTGGYHAPGYEDPSLVGVVNDPVLLADPVALRWSGNNYFTSHMRNIGFMALAFDPADDPGGELGAYLETAIGAHLYMTDHLLRTDARGGLAPEGFEYSPQALAYVAQFGLALHTAGQDDPARWGPQVVLGDNPFWTDVIPGYLHSLSPESGIVPGAEDFGPIYQPAWYGDGLVYAAPEMIGVLGPLGLYDERTGNAERLAAIRWIETETPPGGAEALVSDRVAKADGSALVNAILYFLLFDPAAPIPVDPRPDLPLVHFAPGIGRLLVRTAWEEDAAWFNYGLGWIAIDHQFGDGNGFSFYRDGEWLTKGLVGYGAGFGEPGPDDDYSFPLSENQNTLALENDPPERGADDPEDFRRLTWLAGSQWEYTPAGDPAILGLSVAPGYAYVLGDATNLYNSSYELSTDILHASRSIVWLAPDAIVVYDRAESKTEGRFKRFWLNLPAEATVNGRQTTMTTPGGQELTITTLLPTDAAPEVRPLDIPLDVLAVAEPMRYQFLVEAPGDPRETRFLNVLQGADAGAPPIPAVAVASDDGALTGAVVGTTAVLFPVDVGAEISETRYMVPTGTTAHLITGLVPGGGYDVTTTESATGIAVVVTTGATYQADPGGVVLVGTLPGVLDGTTLALTGTPVAVPTPAFDEDGETAPDETTSNDATPDASDDTDPETPAATPIATEGGAAARGAGQIVYTAHATGSGAAAPGSTRLYRLAANTDATPEDLGPALDALASPAPDDWVNISPDGELLLLGTERFDPECVGWVCLAVVPADLAAAEVVRVGEEIVHPEGRGAIAGDTVVFPAGGGPHDADLWAIRRQGDAWSERLLLTGDSSYAFHAEPALSADGTRVVFECGDVPYGEAGTALCEVGTDATGFRVVLTPEDAPPGLTTTGALRHPTYAPDGAIVFAATWDGTIWRLPTAGALEAVGVAFNNDNAPCALPDSRVASLWLARPGGSGLPELKVMAADGTSYAMLVTDADIETIGCGA